MNDIQNAAYRYADAGIPVLPIIRGGNDDKHPYISQTDATTDPDIIEQWFNKWPNANIAIATGRGLIVIDIDRGHGTVDGIANFNAWEKTNGSFPETWTATTGKGGRHLYIKTDLKIHNVQSGQPDNLKGVDIRGVNGYAIAPPSIAANGQPYTWDVAPDEMPAAENDRLLKQLYADLTTKPKTAQETQETINKGERNGTLTSLAGALRKYNGLTEPELNATLQAVNKTRCQPPLTEKEVESIAKSVARYDGGTMEKKETPAPSFTAYSVKDYLTAGQFEKDVNYFKQYKHRKTGYKNLDNNLTLYPGLMTLGGAASVGKSTFAITLADNLAKAGETVLYFALEQDVIELTTKSLTRALAERCLNKKGVPDPPTDNIGIKNGARGDKLTAARNEYIDTTASRVNIIRCNFTTTASEIRDYIEKYIQDNGVKPICIIDYLQLISPPDDFRGDTRGIIDLAIKTFKQLQLDNELLVILISNFNRSSYDHPVCQADFKESGLIEYTSDFLLGLQLSLLSEKRYYIRRGERNGRNKTTEQEKSEMLEKAIQENPRRVQLVSLKNRNGTQRFTCNFKYYAQYDTFIPDIEKDNWAKSNRIAEYTPPDDDFTEISLEEFAEMFEGVSPQ